jgi:hypothetical protein
MRIGCEAIPLLKQLFVKAALAGITAMLVKMVLGESRSNDDFEKALPLLAGIRCVKPEA